MLTTLVTMMLGSAAAMMPPGDGCASAIAVDGRFDQTFELDEFTYSDGAIPCNDALALGVEQDIWLAIPQRVAERVLVRIESDDSDLVAAVYAGSCGDVGSPVLCIDEPEPMWFELDVETDLLLRIGDFGVRPEGGTVRVRIDPLGAVGEVCSDPIRPDGFPFVELVDTSALVADGLAAVCDPIATVMQNDAWIRYDVLETGVKRLSVLDVDQSFDMVMNVWRGARCDNLELVTCFDGDEPWIVELAMGAGETYWFQVGDWGLVPQGGLVEIGLCDIPLCLGDISTSGTNPGEPGYGVQDGSVDVTDLTFLIEQWLDRAPVADRSTSGATPQDQTWGVPDGAVDVSDLTYFVEVWLEGCRPGC